MASEPGDPRNVEPGGRTRELRKTQSMNVTENTIHTAPSRGSKKPTSSSVSQPEPHAQTEFLKLCKCIESPSFGASGNDT